MWGGSASVSRVVLPPPRSHLSLSSPASSPAPSVTWKGPHRTNFVRPCAWESAVQVHLTWYSSLSLPLRINVGSCARCSAIGTRSASSIAGSPPPDAAALMSQSIASGLAAKACWPSSLLPRIRQSAKGVATAMAGGGSKGCRCAPALESCTLPVYVCPHRVGIRPNPTAAATSSGD